MKRKLLCILLSLVLIVSCIPTASAYSNVSSWAAEAVGAMDSLGLLPQSLENVDMTSKITRAQMCQMAVLVYNQFLGTPGVGPDSTKYFSDTSDPAIAYAFEQGIVGGYGDGTFRPNNNLTRQDFFKITYNVMASAYWDYSSVELKSLDAFLDAGTVSDYALKPTQVMVSIGVVQGDSGRLNPLATTTCEEAIVMFFRAYNYMCTWMNSINEENKEIQIREEGYTGISPWAVREVSEMQDNGMIPACLNNCNMSTSINRAQMCSIAVTAYEKVLGSEYQPNGKNHFTDTSDPDVNAAYELGIVGGYGDGRFGPYDPLTREQFFKIMANFMAVLEYPRKDSNSVSLYSFKDGSLVSDYAKAPTRLMLYIGAVRGDGNYLNPKNNTSIEEAIAVFLRCYKYTVSWKEAHPDGEQIDEKAELRDDICAFARSFEGYRYVYGGNGPNYFDCSGFVLYVYKHFGYSFSRGAQEQYMDGLHVGMSELLPGDLVFFMGSAYSDRNNYRSITHVGLYLGDGMFIHASNPSTGVIISTLSSGHYYNVFFGGCRILKD